MASTDIIKNGYIFSDKVKVFPCAYRGETDNGEKIDPESRINTENNFRKLRGVLTKDSYIISSKTEIAETQIIKCILGGYYFEIDISSVFSDVIGATARYNCLNIKTAAYTGTESEEVLDNSPVLIPFENGTAGNILDEKDEENFYYFKALKFSAQKESDSQYYLDVNSDASYFVVTYKEVESAIIGTHITGSLVEGTVPTAIAQMYNNSGLKNEASGKASFAIGTDTHAKAENTIAGGKESWATSRNSVALGNNTQAKADAAFSMGSGTQALGTYSTAFGQDTKAQGQDSIALGQETYANGVRSFSEGHNTVASGANSHAGGNRTEATAENTLAFGVGTKADQINMTALGIKNAPTKDGDLLVVGNALTIDDDASTILEVNRNYVNIFDKPLSIKYADPVAPPYFCTKIDPAFGIQTSKISIGEQTTDAITLTGSNGNITASSLTLRNGANIAGGLTVNGITSSGSISANGGLNASTITSSGSISATSIHINSNNSQNQSMLSGGKLAIFDCPLTITKTTLDTNPCINVLGNTRLQGSLECYGRLSLGYSPAVIIKANSVSAQKRYFKVTYDETKSSTVWTVGWTITAYSDSTYLTRASVPADTTCSIYVGFAYGADPGTAQTGVKEITDIVIRQNSESASGVAFLNEYASAPYKKIDIVFSTLQEYEYSSTAFVSFNKPVCPETTRNIDLGNSTHLWHDIYAANGTIQTSDRNEKKDILPIDDKYSDLFDSLKPVQYKFKDGHRTHLGLIAQDLEESLEKANIDSEDMAAFVKSEDTENPVYGIRYTEFISLLIKEVQDLKARVNELESQKNKE